jgi:hypothetical protein
MRKALVAVLIFFVGWSWAADSKTTVLPVKRVVLYKNGVAYFEHAGRVRNDQELSIDFNTGQLNDVLKSLAVVDLDGGQITGVRYNSIAPLSERLGSLRLGLGEQTSRSEFLNSVRGSRVEVTSGTITAVGRLLSVEHSIRKKDAESVPSTTITVIGDRGDVRSFDLDPTVTVRVIDDDVNHEINRYMNLIGNARAKDLRRMTISTSGRGERQVLVSYISEVPVWKSTYRIILPKDQNEKALLQGWAIVDNTVGEDWNNVQLSLVAGAPQTFIQEISQPQHVRRPVVGAITGAMIRPQTYPGSGYTPASPLPPPGTVSYDALSALTPQSLTEANRAVIMANQIASQAVSRRLGDLFEYSLKQPITVLKNQSALVPITQAHVVAEKVTIWGRGNQDGIPLRALWLTNSSGLTLDGGTFNIVEDGSFAGEGLLDELRPDERRLISYAADTAVRIQPQNLSESRPVTRVNVAEGVIRFTREEREKVVYKIRNNDKSPRKVVIEHHTSPQWKLVEDVKPEETTETCYRFLVRVEPGKSEEFKVEQRRPLETTYSLTDLTEGQIQLWVSQREIKPELERAFRQLVSKKAEISSADAELGLRRAEADKIAVEQQRIRENMKALRGSIEEKALLQRYVQLLNEQEDRLSLLRREIDSKNTERTQLNQQLRTMAMAITLDESL